MIRRGVTYGPLLPEAAADNRIDRGVAAFVLCSSLVRQFQFAQSIWINDPNFHELGSERDPIIGNQDGSFDITIPKRPVRRKITGLPAFTTVKGGGYFFLPGLKALRYLYSLIPTAANSRKIVALIAPARAAAAPSGSTQRTPRRSRCRTYRSEGGTEEEVAAMVERCLPVFAEIIKREKIGRAVEARR